MKLDAAEVKARARIEDVIRAYGVALKPAGNELKGLCPFHKEKTPSLGVNTEKQLYKCFGCEAGGDVFDFVKRLEPCTFEEAIREVAERVGMIDHPAVEQARERKALQIAAPTAVEVSAPKKVDMKQVATYPYLDERGELLYEVLRYEGVDDEGKTKKTFKVRRPHPVTGETVHGINDGVYKMGRGGEYWPAKDGEAGGEQIEACRRVLYRLPEVLRSKAVVYVEGEKDVSTVEAAGFVATTNSGGAKAPWQPEYTEALSGRLVVVMPDQDEPGKAKGKLIIAALKGKAAVILLNVPGGKDATDFAEQVGVEGLRGLIESAIFEHREAELSQKGLLTASEIIERVEGGPGVFLDPSRRGRGLATGFDRLDAILNGGLRPGQLMVLAARPAMGKTALALCIGANVAAEGKRVAIFSLEMGGEDLLHRVMCCRAMVPISEFLRGDLDAEERGRIQAAANQVVRWKGLAIDDHAGATLKDMERKLAEFAGAGGVDLVILDYLQLMDAKADTREQAIAGLSRGLKKLARKYKVPFLVLSQLSRAVETRGGARPQLSDLRESGAIEQDADIVAFIYREAYYKPMDVSVQGQAEIIIAKQRQGPTGSVKLSFRAEYTLFGNLEREEKAA